MSPAPSARAGAPAAASARLTARMMRGVGRDDYSLLVVRALLLLLHRHRPVLLSLREEDGNMTNVEAEAERRQVEVLRSQGFKRLFAEALAAQESKDRLARARDLKRKYKRRGWKA